MLSTTNPSSIQKRRQQHRRQQSLEVPILATPLPANNRRTKPATQGHQRGLSLDQSLSALNSPTGFRPLLPQDQGLPNAPIRIQIDATNTGHPQPDQHTFVQETQQHRPAQPGYQAQDFQSHLQQQLNGNVGGSTTHIVAPTPTHPSQEQALQELQKHLEWYQQQFGHSPAPTMQNTNTTFFNLTQPMANEMAINLIDGQTVQQQPPVRLPHTPVSHGHSRTVPNTPQHHVQSWPSPPATDTKHIRSQSFQLDVAPMPASFDGEHLTKKIHSSPYPMPDDIFDAADEQARSIYASSVADALSPGCEVNVHPMPTLYEEPHMHTHGGFTEDALLLQTVAGASDDFNSANFIIGNPLGMSPRTAMLHSLGEEVNASIVDTGIPSQDIDYMISEQHPETKVWYCLFEEDNGKKCNKWFKRRENARSHVQNHLGDRQFQCNDCGKTFVRQHDMKRHAAIHKDDRPHICPCGAKFARHDALTRHRQRGMCEGTLPGFEKSEEDKPKRGRPKKERPDMDTRTSKSKKARRLDREHDAAAIGGHYASSISSMSQRSFPVTPPDTNDFDADAFINMASVDVPMSSHASSWRDTPPTSPVSAGPTKTISPALLADHSSPGNYHAITGASSPENGLPYNDVLFGTISSHPGVGGQESLFSDALSPEYGSSDACSPFAGDDDFTLEIMKTAGGGSWSDPFSGRMEGDGAVMAALDRWLSTH